MNTPRTWSWSRWRGQNARPLPGGIDAAKLTRRLQPLHDDPELVMRGKRGLSRLYEPPPLDLYGFSPVGEPTVPGFPENLYQDDKEDEFRRRQLAWDCVKSIPSLQWHRQVEREETRILDELKWEEGGRKLPFPFDRDLGIRGIAEKKVKASWKHQGIWNERWEGRHPIEWRCWRHEEKHANDQTLVGSQEERDLQRRHIAASRPYNQFLYQIAQEREWLENESDQGRVLPHVQAYENVKNSWIERALWDPDWDPLPGNTWMHQDQLGEYFTVPMPSIIESRTPSVHSSEDWSSLELPPDFNLLDYLRAHPSIDHESEGASPSNDHEIEDACATAQVRRSGRIKDRQGTSKSTVFDITPINDWKGGKRKQSSARTRRVTWADEEALRQEKRPAKVRRVTWADEEALR